MLNIFEELGKYKTKSYIHDNGRNISYDNLILDAGIFNSYNVKKILVFVVANNNYDSLVGYVGLLRANAVVALINDSINESVWNELVKKFKPAFIYIPKNLFQCSKVWEKKLNFGGYVFYETNTEIDYKIDVDLSLLLMTSGSTGSPEFVRLSQNNIFSNTKAICEYLNIGSNDVAITTLPKSYSYGISIINTHLFMGASLILTDASLMEKKFWELIYEHNVTTFGGVPYTFEMLKKLKFEKINLPSIKYITQAGGKLSQSLQRYFSNLCDENKIDFVVMYGQTEASPRMSYLPAKMLKKKFGSIGIPIPGGKFYLIDKKNQIINEQNIEGELVYEGENVSLGYARNCYDLASGDSNNGVLKTGDLAKMDYDGYYYIIGRKKRFLKLFGHRVSLDQIEQKINEAGYSCACVGVDDRMKIFTTDKLHINTINNFISDNFNLNISGVSIIYIDKLPRNSSGKILYSELEEINYVSN